MRKCLRCETAMVEDLSVMVTNAAYESGFNDPKYFARVVKKCLNCTPRDLKNYGR